MKIMMVLTSHDELGTTGKKTGFWLEEFAAPFYVFKDSGLKSPWRLQKAGGIPRAPTGSHIPYATAI
jgi:hypothetical protein